MKKKIIAIAVLAVTLAACGGGGSKEEKKDGATEEKKEAAPDLSSNPDYQKGLAIIGNNDCLTCHQVDQKIQGPTYREVADKYASYPDTIIAHLAKKIKSGGSGVWGEIPMTPHPGLSQEDAEALVKYVLLLKSK